MRRKKWANIGVCLALAGLMAFFASGCDEASDDDDSPGLTGNEIILINLGDSLTNGVQSGGIANQYAQVNGYTQLLANQMQQVATLLWNNPLLDIRTKRLDPTVIPHNVGVSGASSQTLIHETTAENEYMNELLQPIPTKMGRPITQLEAAVYVANQYPNHQKIFTLWIGENDVLETVTAGGGTQLTAMHINAFLSDMSVTGEPLNAGHDLESVRSNITTAVDTLKAVPNSHVFIANLLTVSRIACIFNAEDIERLAVFPNPEVTALAEGESMGFVPVAGMGYMAGLSQALATNNDDLNAAIRAILAAGGNDAFSLTSDEAALIDTRVADINAHIASLADSNANVTLVDNASVFDAIRNGQITIGGQQVFRGYHGGAFSADGAHPSNTGYAMIADEFITAINRANVIPPVPQLDLEAVRATDPYWDNDGDGYAPGPANSAVMDSIFIPLMDCDDTDPAVAAPYPVAGYRGGCGT